MPSAAIREANKGVEKATEAVQNKKRSREKYGSYTGSLGCKVCH